MSVLFKEVVFQNNNNIDVAVSIEAPIGTAVASGLTVGPMKTATIPVNRDDCESTAIIASDPEHGEYKQTFALAHPPTRGGRASYLETVAVQYTIADFKGGLTARTSQ